MKTVEEWQGWAAQRGIEIITQPAQVAKLSQDYYHFSPILTPLLADKRGDVVLKPATEEEVIAIAQACVASETFLTVRGSGTGNYGQCIPLQGGVILDTSKLQRVIHLEPGLTTVEPGVKLANLEQQAQSLGWEWRMVPSTVRTATIGGFIAGGSGGIGSILYGQLRDRGNLVGARVVTMTNPVEVIELAGEATQVINHAYGVNGIITALTLPLAPAYPWQAFGVSFPAFVPAAEFGLALGNCDGIIKRLISVFDRPIPSFFTPLREQIPTHQCLVLTLINRPDRLAFTELAQKYGGQVIPLDKPITVIECTWNHTTLHARAADPTWTYLQCLYPDLTTVYKLQEQLGEEIAMHLEFIRLGGKVIPAAIPLVRFTTADRMAELIQLHEAQGVLVANPHTYILEDGGMKTIDREQLAFKQRVDPKGLMNPGKMRAWWEFIK
ncbi:MAG: FAD-binding oxidoreductase [Pseudanabaenaceae cyanobacterium]